MKTENNTAGAQLSPLNRKRLTAAAIIGLFVLPAAISFGLGYYLDYISGDIMREGLYNALSIVNTALTYILPYFAIALCMIFMMYYRGIKRAGGVFCCVLSLAIPYAASIITGAMLISDFRSNALYYSLLFGVNYLLFRLLPLFVSLVAAGMCIIHDTKPNDGTLIRSLRWSAAFFAAADFGYEIYLTVNFIIELTTEYFRAASAAEIISIVLGYVIVAAKTVLGYYLMLITVKAVSAEKESK